MTDILLRMECREPVQSHQDINAQLWPFVKGQTAQGRQIVIEAKLLDDDITDKQRGYLHAGVLTQIAEEAIVNGQKFPMAVWKEFYRDRYLGFKVVTALNPITNRKSRRRVRISTEDIGVRGLALHIDKIIAHASTDLQDKNGDGLTIRAPLTRDVREAMKRYAKREWIDAETGEIHEGAAA